jgi:hypothetical protein
VRPETVKPSQTITTLPSFLLLYGALYGALARKTRLRRCIVRLYTNNRPPLRRNMPNVETGGTSMKSGRVAYHLTHIRFISRLHSHGIPAPLAAELI